MINKKARYRMVLINEYLIERKVEDKFREEILCEFETQEFTILMSYMSIERCFENICKVACYRNKSLSRSFWQIEWGNFYMWIHNNKRGQRHDFKTSQRIDIFSN